MRGLFDPWDDSVDRDKLVGWLGQRCSSINSLKTLPNGYETSTNCHFQRTDARNSYRLSQVKEGKMIKSTLGWSAHSLTLCSSTLVSIHSQEMAPVR
jgi:hypothetical protein